MRKESHPKTPQPGIVLPSVLVDMNMPAARAFAAQLRFSPGEGRISLGDNRMVLLHAEGFGALREELIASLGVDTARGLLTRVGYSAGCRDAKAAWQILGNNATTLELIRSGAMIHAFGGFVLGDFSPNPQAKESYDADNFYSEWIWKNSIEDESHVKHHGIGGEATCWTEVGYASGYLSTIVGRRILVREIECRAMGTAHCRSIAKPVANWGDAAEDLRYMEPQAPPPTSVYMNGTNLPANRPVAADARILNPGDVQIEAVGGSTVWNVLRHKMLRVAQTNATVLLLGESGVGKSMIAAEVHRHSKRAHLPFLEVNCAAIPEQLIEAELFGVERGAYSGATASRPGRFEAAKDGTLFLDEIGTLSKTAQGKLLRVLQKGEFERLGSNETTRTNVRIIAATNEDLQVAMDEGRFREDLYFRLNVFPILIQPLRDRPEDIPLLTDTILNRFAHKHERLIKGITGRAMRALMHHKWPGNIRELENVLERGVILVKENELIDLHHLFSVENALSSVSMLSISPDNGLLIPEVSENLVNADHGSIDALVTALLREGKADLNAIEDSLTRAALKESNGNLSQAARLLGLRRSQLDYRVKKRQDASGSS